MFEKMLINTDMNDIRNILNLLEDVGLTESRGLLYRDKGDVFLRGLIETIQTKKLYLIQ